jgi:hypothetical protein
MTASAQISLSLEKIDKEMKIEEIVASSNFSFF